ncbi:MAG: class I tRNA ligase family protein, partial [Gemmatimonadetes bacterium]|nr:class I tRNA ligase family protein [Gemmatimonadota bacterium]
YARNPASGENVPIWIADYVLMEYGTGAIMGVPAHDERDYEFAKQFGLPIVQVVKPDIGRRASGVGATADGPTHDSRLTASDATVPFAAWEGRLVNSGQFNGMACRDGARAITDWLAGRRLATPELQYRLHDWCISRQRYWGPPIPIIYCDACGIVPVPEEDLPVILPPIEDFRPDDSGISPLARHQEWYHVACPKCGQTGRRETDVSDTFLDSAWYFLRYPSTQFDDRPFDPALTKKWLPVKSYIGGNEHAVLHLMYSRFTTMALHDLGFLDFEEPYARFRAHGTIVKDGAKMSKSRGNVVIPDDYVARWGADTFRLYMMFLGPYQEGGDFQDQSITGPRRFLDKLWTTVSRASEVVSRTPRGATDSRLPTHDDDWTSARRKLHQTIRKVTANVEELRYNTAIAAMMEYVNLLQGSRESGVGSRESAVPVDLLEPLLVLLAPCAPQ